MSRRSKIVIALGLVPILLLGGSLAAWAVDSSRHDGKVVRNTELAGVQVGGQTRIELEGTVDELARRFPDTPITISTDDGIRIDTTAGELGLRIDTVGTTEAAMSAGRNLGAEAPLAWARSLREPWRVKVALTPDAAVLDAAIARLEGTHRTDPVEPGLVVGASGLTLAPGRPGRRIDPATVARELPADLTGIGTPIEVRVTRIETPPKLADTTVQGLVDQATTLTSGKIQLTAGSKEVSIDGADLRPMLSMRLEGDTPTLALDEARLAKYVTDKFPTNTNVTGVRFNFDGGTPTPVAGKDAAVCCGAGVGADVAKAVLAGTKEIKLPTRTYTAAEGVTWAQGLGVKEVIGEFTTNHPCCAPRVKNIHLISDMTRGVLIAPGETFSVNNFVGKRTPEKGFVIAGVIQDGEFTEDYGGGISQYATTLFNAAFFGGLDIPAYKAHSKWLSRYPLGREATLAYPGVDLKIRNNTPYGVVIQPTYTDTSITVRLWSTKFVTGQQTARKGDTGCGVVTVERTRTWVDGRTAKDTFRADYDCSDTGGH